MIVIVDYGAGNLASVERAVSYLGYESVITDNPQEIAGAERIIFPGVGAAGAAMEIMHKKGIDNALKQAFDRKVPMLGICVGCQIIMDRSEENNAVCLGIIEGEAKAFPRNMPEHGISSGNLCVIHGTAEQNRNEAGNPVKTGENDNTHGYSRRCLKVPHMGWNALALAQPHPLLEGLGNGDEFYFVHSYFPVPADENNIYGKTEYGITFASAIGKDNLFATQFHLEKSGEPGLLILKNFCVWKP